MPAAPPPLKSPEAQCERAQEKPASRLRLFGLVAGVVLIAALPLAGASAGPPDGRPERPAAPKAESVPKAESAPDGAADKVDDKAGPVASATPAHGPADEKPGDEAGHPASPLLTGLGMAAAAQCGPQLTSPEGIEAQTCVLRQAKETWARTYYRNTTGEGLSAVLTLMAPDGRTVRITCAVGAEDEPGMCETPRGPTRAEPARYAAVAEYAADGEGPLLLRSGTNSAPAYGR
ncbi:hypothetical protein [Streptomyces sp. NPDC016845]|uniref:hypothetical protein n=1 Tax=Streptomyces sp. NPDC016845 TaxID=3364972 RepID=UPI00378BDEBD